MMGALDILKRIDERRGTDAADALQHEFTASVAGGDRWVTPLVARSLDS
jgi:hypothetical protein